MSFLAKHAQGKGGPDPIFAYGGRAAARAQEIGKENVINATIGAFLNPDGTLSTMKTVEEAMKAVPFQNQSEMCDFFESYPSYTLSDLISIHYTVAIMTLPEKSYVHVFYSNVFLTI